MKYIYNLFHNYCKSIFELIKLNTYNFIQNILRQVQLNTGLIKYSARFNKGCCRYV